MALARVGAGVGMVVTGGGLGGRWKEEEVEQAVRVAEFRGTLKLKVCLIPKP